MKNLFLITGSLFLFNLSSYSQIISTDKKEETIVKISAKAGYSLGQLSSSSNNIYTKDYESIEGIDWGFAFEFPLTKTLSIQPEINITHRGGKRLGLQPVVSDELVNKLNMFLPFYGLPTITNENPLYATYESESDLSYLETPVLVKFGWGNNFRIYGEIGPYIGILLKAKQHTNGTSKFYYNAEGTNPVSVPGEDGLPPFTELPEQSLTADTDIKDDLNTVNFGAIVGFGVIKKINKKSEVFLDARVSYSFNAIQINTDYGKSNVGGVIFSLGYTYYIN